ncbi:hypothetical protein GGI25_000768 [Coemansia spiralis]|uniref:GRAM domain-containing protein n=2 Tax=Coemansia TaxID=4863 RepID=A0A9W8L0U9_9FUNG|nr:hypothetical protein EDC05_005864 [Coemansia umbellata]KAJ2621942.1 hypothetical protein GGI26_003646 [Coemansia sp. RSA 1358]KAJ2680476.1 hypothetical protein GGI25_000768 [Coemansia spiralis]
MALGAGNANAGSAAGKSAAAASKPAVPPSQPHSKSRCSHTSHPTQPAPFCPQDSHWFNKKALTLPFHKRALPPLPPPMQPVHPLSAAICRTLSARASKSNASASTEKCQKSDYIDSDCSKRHASKGRQVALKVAQRAASLTRLLSSRKPASAQSLDSSRQPSAFPSYSAIVPPRRAYSYGTSPATNSIGHTLLLMNSADYAHDYADISANDDRFLEPASAAIASTVNSNRKQLAKGHSRLGQAFPDLLATEPHALRDFVCSLDHAGVRWYGRIYVCSTHLCFTGVGISLTGSGSRRANTTTINSEPVSLGSPIASSSNLSLASTPYTKYTKTPVSLEQTHQPSFARLEHKNASAKRLSLGANSLPSRSPTKLTLSAEEMWSLQQPKNGYFHSSSGPGDYAAGGSNKKPWRRMAIKLPLSDITRVSKELTMGVWPNAMTVATNHRQYIFTNFLRREKAYQCLFDAWTTIKEANAATINLQISTPSKKRPQLPLPSLMAGLDTTRDSSEQQPTEGTHTLPFSKPAVATYLSSGEVIGKLPQYSASTRRRNQQHMHKNPFDSRSNTRDAVACHAAQQAAGNGDQQSINETTLQPIAVSVSCESSSQQRVSQPQTNLQLANNNNHNHHRPLWQRLDPVMLVGQLIGIVSQSTLFILLSLVLFCLLSSITFL